MSSSQTQRRRSRPVLIDPFHAIDISRLAHELEAAGQNVIHMEFGQPSTGAPRSAIEAAHRVLDTDGMGYWESPALRHRIARHYGETQGIEVDPANILLTSGASPALVLALLTAFEPGSRVAFARPGYVAYRNSLRALHMNPVEIECGADTRFQLTAAALDAIDDFDGTIIASPANPTGTILSPEELASIVACCAARDATIVSDEIYHGLTYAAPATSVLRYTREAFVVNSFSKYFSMAGWRLGWLVVPDRYLAAARARIGNLFLSPPSLAQHAALAAFDSTGELEAHVATYRRNRELLLDALPRLGLDMMAPPDGAFYLYISVAHLTDDCVEFCRRMLEATGIAVAPGIDFDPQGGRQFIRLSFAVSSELVVDAIERLGAWLPIIARSLVSPPHDHETSARTS
ncbi:aminotransferase class I/II-fold pyridoxal phosphate-dependent enzyme [Sphingomonas sp. UV9]|uniref:aminotransferase class I/II-fold pyridoxal phosphate-dependent enzyme n=1 Tax=Sphingomonas sp. UV9 TaxID=1851410 RepID=UPI000FFC4E9A|nr:aminotransferase class I/II-fold pyridoxal phosphate-dependent enzyme [Sphingomonas sp. UV9]RXD05811.1 aminotransferase class I/II-fold pyridoxal phosphate-dependent enzyme [Sphingomonas sp. UV9]